MRINHTCSTDFFYHFTDKWEVGVGVGVGVVAVARIEAEVAVGVTTGSTPDSPNGLTHQTAPQSPILPWNSTAGMAIHWELWAAVIMVSYLFILNKGKKLKFNWISVFVIQILTEKIQLLSPSLMLWLCPLNRWAQLWAHCWPTMAPWVRVTVVMSLKVNLHLPSTKAPLPNHQDPTPQHSFWLLWKAWMPLCSHALPHNPTGIFSFSRLNPKNQRSSPRKSGCPASSASNQKRHGSLNKHHPLFREGRRSQILAAKFCSEHSPEQKRRKMQGKKRR